MAWGETLALATNRRVNNKQVRPALLILEESIQVGNVFRDLRTDLFGFADRFGRVWNRRERQLHDQYSDSFSGGIQQWEFQIVELPVIFLGAVSLVVFDSVKISFRGFVADPARVARSQ
jgi:hypothetical protein